MELKDAQGTAADPSPSSLLSKARSCPLGNRSREHTSEVTKLSSVLRLAKKTSCCMTTAIWSLVLLAGLCLRSLDLVRAHGHLPFAEEDREVVPVSRKLALAETSLVLACRPPATVQRVLLPDFDHVVRKEEHNREGPERSRGFHIIIPVRSQVCGHRYTAASALTHLLSLTRMSKAEPLAAAQTEA